VQGQSPCRGAWGVSPHISSYLSKMNWGESPHRER